MANQHKKKKIETSGKEPQPLSGNPFGALDDETLNLPAEQAADTPISQPRTPKTTPRETVLRRERPPQGGKIAVVAGQFRPGDLNDEQLESWRSELAKSAACSVKIREGELWVHADRPADVAAFFEKHGLKVRGVTF